MSACGKCGHDPAARVIASWEFTLSNEIRSLNRHIVNHGAQRHVYRRQRNAWAWLLRAARIEHRIPTAIHRRRLTLTRIHAGLQRELDADNLVGGAKPLVDAIAREGLLVDDKPDWVELHHAQERGAAPGVRVLLEELGP